MNYNSIINVATASNSFEAVNLNQMNTSILAMGYVMTNGLVRY